MQPWPEDVLAVDGSLRYGSGGLMGRAALTGDVTASASSNATTIANDAVTFAKFQNVSTDIILGRATAGSGDVEELSSLPFAFTGDVTRAADSNAQVIAAGVVTQAMLALDEQHPSFIAGSAYELADFYDSGTRILLTNGPALTADRVYFFPFKYKGAASITITAFEAKVTTNVAASNFRMGIYADSAGVPSGAALVDTGNMSGASLGYVTSGAVSLALAAGKYWMAVAVSAALGFNGYNGGCVPVVGGTFGTDNIYNCYRMTNTFGALPTVGTIVRDSISAPPRFKIQI